MLNRTLTPLVRLGGMLLVVLVAANSNAANVSMTASDASGTSSLNSAGKWSNALAPNATNDYFTAGFLLRTPASGSSNYFLGKSLSLDFSPTNALVGLAMKYPSSGSVRVDNLKLNGGGIFNGQGGTMSVYGNITVLTNSYLDPQANGRVLAIYAPISGGSTNTINFRASAGNSGGVVQVLGDGSGYAGKYYIWGVGDSAPGAVLQVGNGGTTGSLGVGNVTNNNSLRFNRSDSFTVANVISGAGSVVMSGTGRLTLSGANTYAGGTSFNAGVVNFASLANLGIGDLNFAGGTLQFAAGNTADISTRNVNLTGACTLDVGTNTVTLANSIGNSGVGSLTKAGSGKVTLESPVTYTGSTIVSAGTLALGAGGALSSSPVISLASGASLDVSAVAGFGLASGQTLAGSGTVVGAVTYAYGATISPGDTNSGTLTVNGDAALGNCSWRWELNVPNVVGVTNDLLVVNGNLALTPGIAVNMVFPAGIPIPGTYTLCQCTGSLTGDPTDLTANLGNYSVTFALNSAATPRTVTVTIAGMPQNLRWTGQSSSEWDTTSLNWINTVGLTNTLFSPGDVVRFDDTAVQTSVTVGSLALPARTTVDTALSYIFSGSGSIAGPGGLTKSGSGTLVLDLTNSYAGSTLIQSGVVQLGNGDDTGTFGLGPVTNQAAIVLNRSDAAGVVANAISGPGILTSSGIGTVTLSGSSDYTGLTTVSSGTLKLGSATALGSASSPTVVADGAVLDINGQTNVLEAVTINGVGAGTGALINSATGNAILNGPVTLASDATVGGSRNLTLNGAITGPFALTKAGTGTTTLAATNLYTGGTVVNAGVLSLSNNLALGGGAPVTINSGSSVLQLNGGITIAGVSLLNNNGATGANGLQSGSGSNAWTGPVTLGVDFARFGAASNSVLNLRGVVADDGNAFGLRVRGADGAGVLLLSAPNTYLGGTSVDVGLLRLGNAMALPPTTGVGVNNLSGAVLDLAGFSPQIIGLTGIGLATNSANTMATLTLNTSNAINYFNVGGVSYNNGGPGSNNFFGVIGGNVALTKAGEAGTVLYLTNANTFVGDTTIAAGTLALSASGSLVGSTNIVVAAGATFDVSAKTSGFTLGAAQTLRGNGTVSGSVIANGTVAPGASIGTLTLSGNLQLQPGSTTAVEVQADGARDQIVCGGTVTYGGVLQVANLAGTLTTNNTFRLFSAASYAGAFASISPAPGAGLAWSTNTLRTDGTLRIVTGVALTPTNLTVSVTGGNTLQISWPADHLGWWLQAQTNSASVGLGTNWFKVPNSSTVNQMSLPIDPANPAVFFRLVYP